ncbi:sulfotransferase family protein [Rhodocaloribacter sp.]
MTKRLPVGLLKNIPFWLRAKPSARRHIFITGAPRSGTTLLKTILTAHSKVAGGDYESTGLFKLRDLNAYECGEISKEQAQALLKESAGLVEFYDRIADQLLAYWGGEIFVDKIWPRAFRLWYVVNRFPEARWLHIVRDARDCFCSARHHPNVPQGRDLKTFARYWVSCNRLIEQYVPEERRLTLKYETLVASSKEVIPAMMAFLGLNLEEGQYHPAKAGRIPSVRHAEYHKRLTQPLDARSVGRYRSELTEEEKTLFRKVAGSQLAGYGYHS